jgi:hypothetical protein
MDGRHHDISQLDGKALVASSCWSFWCMMQALLSRKTKELTKVLRGSSSQILANLSTAGYTPEVYGRSLGSWHTSPRTTCHDLRQWSRLFYYYLPVYQCRLCLARGVHDGSLLWGQLSYPITVSSIILNFTLYKQHNLHKFLSAADGPWAVATNIATTATTWCRQMLRRFWIMTQQSNSNTSSIRSGWSSAFISNHTGPRLDVVQRLLRQCPRDPKIRRVPLIAFYEIMPGAGSYLTS